MSSPRFLRSIAARVPPIQRLVGRVQELERQNAVLNEQLARGGFGGLDAYVTHPPSRGAALEIFDGLWSSDIPGYGFGRVRLFDDQRITWFLDRCGGVVGKKILELGPLEGGHTYMLSRAGARAITSIEGNKSAFLKCLVVQNVLKFDADFILGDFRPFLRTCEESYDLLVASGVLYHMMEPARLLQDMAKVASSIALWTHYYDPDVIRGRPDLAKKFAEEPLVETFGGRQIVSYRQSYLEALNWGGFCGGSAPTSYWLTRDSLLGMLEALGYAVEIGADEKDHPNGPCMTLFAKR